MTRTEAQKSLQWKAVDRSRARYINEYEKRFLRALNAQIAPVIVAIRNGKDNPENYIVELPVLTVLEDLYTRVGRDFARDTYDSLTRKAHSISYQTKADEPESQWMRFVRRWIGKEGAEKVKNITDTTRNFVRKVLDQGASEGLGTDKMARLMIDEAEGINLNRAKVIARTEIISCSNLSSLEGARSTGIKLNKEWLATRDKRTRSSHIGVDGQEVGLDELFSVNGSKLDYPGDSTNGAPGSETIQCRCSQVYNPV